MKHLNFCLLLHSTAWAYFFNVITSTSLEGHTKVLNGKDIKILAYQYPPLFYYQKLKDGNFTFGGMFKKFLDDAKEYFNMSIKYVILDPVKITKYGFWGALFDTLDNKEVDLVPCTMAQDFDSLKHMEIAAAIWISPLKLLQPWPDEQSRLEVTTRPFQSTVWLLFFATTAIFVFITAAFIKNRHKIENNVSIHHTPNWKTVFNQVEYVFRIMTNQGNSGSHARERSSFKILTGIWLLSMVVLINGYSGVLTSLLTSPNLNPIVNTAQELTESKELRVTVEKNVPMSNHFLEATEGYEKILGDELREYPSFLVPDINAAYENVVQHKGAYPGVDSIINYMIREDLKIKGYCRLTSSPELRAYQSTVFQWGIPIGSLHVPAFTEMTLRFWANGIIAHYKNTYFHGASQCRTDVPPKTRIRSLTLIDMSPAFFILGLGILLSSLCFLLEIIVTYITDRIG